MLTHSDPMAPADLNHLAQTDPKRLAQAALRTFFNITQAWQCTSRDEIILLGQPPRSTFYKWKKCAGDVILPKDTLERISYIFGIYGALRVLFPTDLQACAWPARPNAAFHGKSALDVMLGGNVTDLAFVRRYLDAMRG